METKKLSLQEMEMVQGGNMLDCLAQGVSGAGVIIAVAAATNPLGWAFVGIAAVGFGLSYAANPDAC